MLIFNLIYSAFLLHLNGRSSVNIVSRSCFTSHFHHSETDLNNIEYDIFIRPVFKYTLIYQAKLKLSFTLMKDLNQIVIHYDSHYYKIMKLSVLDDNDSTISIKNIFYCSDFRELIILFDQIYPKSTRIKMEFWIENYPDNLSPGLSYKSNMKRIVLTSEPKNFRTVFPAIDEPSFRGRFKFYLIRETTQMSLSNMVKENSSPVSNNGNSACDRFAKRLVGKFLTTNDSVCDIFPQTEYAMSTYLFTFTFSNVKLKSLQGFTKNSEIPVILYFDKLFPTSAAEYFINFTLNAIDYFETYLNTSYPGKPVQNIVTQMNTGAALETWNMIIYNEYYGVLKSVIAHEIAHQWFGNLVSITNWKYLWLKEGVTTLLQEHFNYKDKDFKKKMREHKLTYFKKLDVIESCNEPSRIMETIKGTFDYTYRHYSKPSIILNMVQFVIFQSPAIMRRGLGKLAHQYANKSIDETIFWSCFDPPPDLPDTLENIMSPWFSHPHVPIVKIARNENNVGHYSFSQETFCRLCEDTNPVIFPYVKVIVKSNSTETFVWIPHNQTVTIDLKTSDDEFWVTVDPEDMAYYWVHFEEDLMASLISKADKENDKSKLPSYTKSLQDFLWSSLLGLYSNSDSVFQMFNFALKTATYQDPGPDDSLRSFIETFFIDQEMIEKLSKYTLLVVEEKLKKKLSLFFYYPKRHKSVLARARDIVRLKMDLFFRCSFLPNGDPLYILKILKLRSKVWLHKALDCIFQESLSRMELDAIFSNAYINYELSEYFAKKFQNQNFDPPDIYYGKFSSKNWCAVMKKIDEDKGRINSCQMKKIIELAIVVCTRQKQYLPGLLDILDRYKL